MNVKTVCEICSLEMPKSKFYSHRNNVHKMKPLREKARPRARISVLKASMNKQEAAQGFNGEENGNNQAFGTIAPRANIFRTPISVLRVTTNLHQGAGLDINREETGKGHRLQNQSQASVKPGQGENT